MTEVNQADAEVCWALVDTNKSRQTICHSTLRPTRELCEGAAVRDPFYGAFSGYNKHPLPTGRSGSISSLRKNGFLVKQVIVKPLDGDHYAALVEGGQLEEAQAQSIVRRLADGMAARTRALKLLGNGVQPLAAAYAWRSLSFAHGLCPLDLAAADRGGPTTTDEHVLMRKESDNGA